ncbi:hypothetical protein ACYZT3_19550 [Pseudomonas sp. MDT1-16]
MTVTTFQLSPVTSSLHNGKALCWLAHLGPALLTILFIWLPFGFAMIGLLEEWGVIGLFSRIGVFFIADVSSAMPAHSLRPLTIFPHSLAYFLDSNTFNYWHVLLTIALVIKGWALSVITTRITGTVKWGMMASVLVIIFPADTMQLSFRSIHINWALSLALLGCVIFLQALEQKSKVRSFTLSGASSLLLAAGCALYEVALVLAIIPALVIFIQIGFKKIIPHIKTFYIQHLIWASGAIVYIAYVIHTAPLVQSYQGAVVGDSALSSLNRYYPKIFSLGVMRSLFGGWIDAIKITLAEFTGYGHLVLTTATLLLLVFIVSMHSKSAIASQIETNPPLALILRMAAAGIVIICLGYLPLIFNIAHMSVSQRTFLYAAPGATLVFVALLLAINYFSKIATALVATVFVFTGLASQLYQLHHYIDISKRQQLVLRDIIRNFDGNAANKTLVILDYNNQLNHDWMFLNPNLAALLFHIYGKPVDTLEVCYMPSHEWQQSEALLRKGSCEETADSWIFHYPTSASGPGMAATDQPPSKKHPKSEIVTVVVGNGDTEPVTAELEAHRQNLESTAFTMSARYRGLTQTQPWFDFLGFRDETNKDEYFWSFGNRWSLDIPIAGSEWKKVEWEGSRISHNASAWKIAPRASLNFEMTTAAVPYSISGSFNAFTNESIRSEMQVLVNGSLTPIQWGKDGNFSGNLDPTTLKSGRNVIEFVSQVDDKHYGLSARLDWVKVAKESR